MLENQLRRLSVMKMEADIVHKKYKHLHLTLKIDATSYAFIMRKLAENFREMDLEVEYLKVSLVFK